MSSIQGSNKSSSERPGQGCARTAGVSCLTSLILLVIILFWMKSLATGPNFDRMATCQKNIQEIGGALSRYAIRYQKYPDQLSELYPDFMETKSVLHCPSSTRDSKETSYTYYPPKLDAPGSTVMLTCRNHEVLKNIPTIIILTKNGGISVQPVKRVPMDEAQKKHGTEPSPSPDRMKSSPKH